nr:MAG TPA_asm: hypothetical protein [Bacteriophage sp.]
MIENRTPAHGTGNHCSAHEELSNNKSMNESLSLYQACLKGDKFNGK